MIENAETGETYSTYDGQLDSAGNIEQAMVAGSHEDNGQPDYNHQTTSSSTNQGQSAVGFSALEQLQGQSNGQSNGPSSGLPWYDLSNSSGTNFMFVTLSDKFMALMGDMEMDSFRTKTNSLYRICVDSGCNFLAIFFDKSYFPMGVSKSEVNITGVTGSGNALGQGIAVAYGQHVDGTWYRLVMAGAALQPDCPVNLLALDALLYKSGEQTGNDVNFKQETISMATCDGTTTIPLPRDSNIRLNFIHIEPENDFKKRGIPKTDIREYFLV